MKVTDYNEVYAAAADEIADSGSKLTDYVDIDTAAIVLMNIYNMADAVSGFGQDIDGKISVISNNRRISVIANGVASGYKHTAEMCLYEDIEVDMNVLNMCLDFAIERMEANSV